MLSTLAVLLLASNPSAAREASQASYEENDETPTLASEPVEAADEPGSGSGLEDESADEPSADEDSNDDATPTDADSADEDDSTQTDSADGDADPDSFDAESEEPGDDADETDPKPEDGEPESDLIEPELIQERYPNRAIRIEREVRQDANGNYVNHGVWKMWDQRGNVIAEGQFQDGERDGTWNRWYRAAEVDLIKTMPYEQFTGPYISQATFNGGKLEGKWTIYDAKQHKISEIGFSGGQRHGKSTWWYASGQKMREIDYRDGEIDGQYVEWTPDNRPIVRDTYQGGRKLARKSAEYSSTQKKSEGTYLFAKDVVRTPDDWWNAHLATYEKQGKDEKHGPWTAWYITGQKQMLGEYRNDAQVGKFTWWHANGQKALEGSYINGKQNGKWVWWHQNGQKSIQGEYVMGNPTGQWSWWGEDGKVNQAANLSHSEGKVVDMPAEPKESSRASRSATRPRKYVR